MAPAPDLDAADDAVARARAVVDAGAAALGAGGRGGVDEEQVVAYDLAHAAAAVALADSSVEYGRRGPVEAGLATAFVADALHDLAGRLHGREATWGVSPGALAATSAFVAAGRDPAWLASLAGDPGPRHLDPDLELAAQTFRRFAEERIAPVAGDIHRHDTDVPEAVIEGLAALGAFGLSIPEAYGGSATGSPDDQVAVVVATEELSRRSLAAGGSLITRPEILARALLAGGTDAQKRRWLPELAAGRIMAAVAVTEPDRGSDVAGVSVAAMGDGEEWVVSGTKTWCTFAARADVIMLLARTEPDRSLGHRGLSVLIAPKARADGRGFVLGQPGGGRLEGRPIRTPGYRGMHSYELAFDGWRVPADHLVGGEAGRGRGFHLQMQGFDAGRLQTAARAVGVMQAAYEAARTYGQQRHVFGRALGDFQLSQVRLTRMAAVTQACRQYAYRVARLMSAGGGTLEAAMLKAYACAAAEWVTRQAQQLHGGMGYAEEYEVCRLWADARVLSIFEGADETLALKVIARRLAARGGSSSGGDPGR